MDSTIYSPKILPRSLVLTGDCCITGRVSVTKRATFTFIKLNIHIKKAILSFPVIWKLKIAFSYDIAMKMNPTIPTRIPYVSAGNAVFLRMFPS